MTCVCVWLGAGGVGGEWVTGLGLGFTNYERTWGKVGYVSVFWLGECGWAAWARLVGVVLYLCVL